MNYIDIKTFEQDGLLELEAANALGTQFDNGAQTLRFSRSEKFAEHDLILFCSDGKACFMPVKLGRADEFTLPNALTTRNAILIQIAYEDNGVSQRSNRLEVRLRPSIKSGFEPALEWPNPLRELMESAVAGVAVEGSLVRFYNLAEEELACLELAAPSERGGLQPGIKGDKGETGAQGIPGVKGDNGDTGETGAQGIPGANGDKGDKGETGAQGTPGVNGDKGDKGETGAQGIPGVNGDKGDKGETGAQGIPGAKGDKGDTGETGAQGIPGAKGDKGDKGETGAQGIPGAKGDKGDKGDPGNPANIAAHESDSSAHSDIRQMLNSKAGLSSPIFTGTPTAPNPSGDSDSTQIATTAFTQALMGGTIRVEPDNITGYATVLDWVNAQTQTIFQFAVGDSPLRTASDAPNSHEVLYMVMVGPDGRKLVLATVFNNAHNIFIRAVSQGSWVIAWARK